MGTHTSRPARPAQLYRVGKSSHGQALFATSHLPPGTRVAVETAWLVGADNWTLVLNFLVGQVGQVSQISQISQGQPVLPSMDQVLKQYHRSNAVLRAWDYADQTNLAMTAKHFRHLSDEQIKQLLDVMATNCLCTNALQHSDREPQPRRLGMFNILSKVNHACNPNCEIVNLVNLAGKTDLLVLVTNQAVQAGQELSIAYMTFSTTTNTKQRREELYNEHGFVCNCADCVDCQCCQQCVQCVQCVQSGS
jgi:hypothetical protein